ncbi:MAG: SusC/RagA family TonB-linked outer membrane protein [Chitinophagaceae bacterium]|nr:SusC/RagA family TonB-linked outer membrane protein [Chitinophagaceae bacterium]
MKKGLLLLLGQLLFITAIWAQRSVSGKVTDDEGKPLPNVSVSIKGSKKGTTTNADGIYAIAVETKSKTLIFSSVSMTTKEVAIGNENTLNVTLQKFVSDLSEIVVTGVGVATSKKKLGISVESISADKLPGGMTASIDQALVGKIAGAQISSTNGSPGRPTNILLRGINTINRGTLPMIMLDGIEVRGTDLNSLDLSNIDRVEVVQGAASATIYGAQGANGVIQLFSKKGKMGKINIDISSSASRNTMLNNGNVEKARFHGFTTNANGDVIGASGNPIAFDPSISVYRENVLIDLNSPNTLIKKPYDKNLKYYDHFKEFYIPSTIFNNSLTISGAREQLDFMFSVSDNRQGSTFKRNGDFSRSNLTSNIGITLAKNLKFRTTTQLIYTKNTLNDPTGRGIMFALNNSRPFADYNHQMPNGDYGYYFGDATGVNGYNPNYRTQYSSNLDNKIDIVQNFNLNYKPIKFLELDVKYGMNYQTQDVLYDVKNQDENASAKFWTTRWWTGFYGPTPNVGTSGEMDNFRYRTFFQNLIGTATISTDFKKDFNINIPLKTTTQLAYDYRKNDFQQLITWGIDAPFYAPYTANQMGTQRIQSDYREPFVTYGYLVNQRFEIGDWAGVSGGFRSDYSSAFGKGSKPATFPRGDAYVRLSQFNFWKNSSLNSAVSEFKIRAAYGKAGIQPRAFDRIPNLASQNIGSAIALRANVNYPNPELNVEISKELEVGTDITIRGAKGKWFTNFNLSATYWDRSTDNAIYDVDQPPSTGIGRIRDNAFGLKSNGIQASLNATILQSKNINWNFTTNFSKQTSMISAVKDNGQIIVLSNAGSSNYVLQAGEKVGQLYGNRLITSLTQTNAAGVPYIPTADHGNFTVASNGWVVNKTTNIPFVTPEKVSLGDPNPKFNMSFINEISYKNFLQFNFQWDWVYKSHIYNQTKQWMYRDGIHSDYAKPITVDGVTEAYASFYRGVYANVQANGTRNYFYEDASFLRLRNLAIAFDAAKFVKIKGFTRLQLVLTGRNLLTATKYTGFDPEVSSGTSNSAFDRGVDHNTVPNLKTYQVGLNIGF